MLTTAVGDFNGDGFADLAIGVPEEAPFSDFRAGGVNIAYGSVEGLNDRDDFFDDEDEVGPPADFISQDRRFGGQFVNGEDRTDIDGETEGNDQFGYSLAAGDFDGDGFDDLAIGVPFEDFPDLIDAGAVNILYGSTRGLTTKDSLFLHQDIEFVGNRTHAGDQFGFSLAAGDFDGDGYDDLAVGVPREDVGDASDAGIVHLFRGSRGTGLNRIRDLIFSQNTSSVLDVAEKNDRFGYTLAAGNFNGDRGEDNDPIDDLAVGVPWEDDAARDSGLVSILYGSDDGLNRGIQDQRVRQGSLLAGDRIEGVAERLDRFGYSLAIGSINGDGLGSGVNRRNFDDLVVGVPYEDLDTSGDPNGFSLVNAGGVNIIFGSSDGLVGEDNQFFTLNTQQTSGGVIIGQIEGESNGFDLFGFAVSVGDFDGDGFGDLAASAPRRNGAAGSVTVIFGRRYGLTARGDTEFFGTNITAGDREEFGSAVAAGDFDGDGFADLFVTIPGRDVDIDPRFPEEDIKEDLGSAILWYGGDLPFEDADVVDQRTLGGGVGDADDDSEQNDRFGGRSSLPNFS